MAKKQTRKTVSISKQCYDAAVPWAESQGRSLSSLIEEFLRREMGLPPRDLIVVSGTKRLAPIQPARVPPSIPPSQSFAQEHARLKREAEEAEARAIDNPCRSAKCKRVSLHEAHEGDHDGT